ncbi:Protein ALP1-like [Merluccius polli]|uniref:Protein ALP1-like n=1 Tax=Merluccius polli TaxID=89951 RepID=A0AA47M480_MERPO|nr:Protein ALP1-like [Merluccius polli]
MAVQIRISICTGKEMTDTLFSGRLPLKQRLRRLIAVHSRKSKLKSIRRAKSRKMIRWIMCMAACVNAWYIERTPQERGHSFWETEVLQKFLEKDWYVNFRMPKEAFNILCDQLRPYVNPQTTNMLDSVPIEKRVAITLYKLGSNVEFHDVANLFGIGASTACNIFWERPKTVPEVQAIITDFERKTGFPMCAGVLDGTHIPVIAPVSYPIDYYNRKGWYSVEGCIGIGSRGTQVKSCRSGRYELCCGREQAAKKNRT